MDEISSLASTSALSALVNSYNSASRLPIALHLPQDVISQSLSSFANVDPSNDPDEQTLGGSGYGPRILSTPTSIQTLIANVLEPTADGKASDYDMVVMPLSNEKWQIRWQHLCLAPSDGKITIPTKLMEADNWRALGSFKRSEVNITRSEEIKQIIVQAPDWLELDSPVEGIYFSQTLFSLIYHLFTGIRFDAELVCFSSFSYSLLIPHLFQALKQEVSFASYLHITTIILPPPRNSRYLIDYARAVNSALTMSAYIHVSSLICLLLIQFDLVCRSPYGCLSHSPSPPSLLITHSRSTPPGILGKRFDHFVIILPD